MAFTNLDLRVLDKDGEFKVLNDFNYAWLDKRTGKYREVRVPSGFETNLASIPKPLRSFFSRIGKSRKPAVVHDYLYAEQLMSRKKCDQLFRQMLIERGVSKFKAYLYYSGVRVGGNKYYKKVRKIL